MVAKTHFHWLEDDSEGMELSQTSLSGPKLLRRATQILQSSSGREILAGSTENGDFLDLFQATSILAAQPTSKTAGVAGRRKATIDMYAEILLTVSSPTFYLC